MRFKNDKQRSAVMSKEKGKTTAPPMMPKNPMKPNLHQNLNDSDGGLDPIGEGPSRRGPRKFRRNSLTRVDHDSFPE